MTRHTTILCIVFFVGFTLGILTGWYRWDYSSSNNGRSEVLAGNDKGHPLPASGKGAKTPISSTISSPTSTATSQESGETVTRADLPGVSKSQLKKSSAPANSPPQAAELSAEEILLKYPPPHVTDPYFFGPKPRDPEVMRLREQALNDLIRSMEEAGLPAADINAALEQYENEIRDSQTVEQPSSTQPPPTPEEAANQYAQSLREAGESEENIQQMVTDFKQGIKENQNAAGKDEDSVSDPETGLNHPPPLPDE